MPYLVLARKYRPQLFREVIGQDHVTHTLLNALTQHRIAHGYIFSGHRGIGKTTIARILAMALNCRNEIRSAERPTAEPCGVCDSCAEIRAGNAVDVIEIDAATNRGIDEIRELRDAARYRPSRDRYKIYILDEAHQITDAAFNALLKTLEEPPDHVIFMMATTQPEDIPQTIRSRCQHYSFHAVRFDDIVAQLRHIAGEENIDTDEEALALLAEAGDGSMRDALSIMDQAIASAPVDESGKARIDASAIRDLMGNVPNSVFERILRAVSANQSVNVLTEAACLLDAGHSPQQLARQFVRYLRNAVVARLAGESSDLLQISPDERQRVFQSAMLFGEEELTRFLNVMLRTFDELNYRQEQRFHLELGLLRLVHLQRLLPVEEILTAAARLSAPAPRPTSATTHAPATRIAAPTVSAAAPSHQAPPSPFEADKARKETAARPLEPPAARPSADAMQAKSVPLPEDVSLPSATAAAAATLDVDALRAAILNALAERGHTTVTTLLSDSQWSQSATGIEVQTLTSKTLLGVAYNQEAEKIAKEVLRAHTPAGTRITVLAGNGSTPQASSAPARNTGSSAKALEHPGVQQARDLFRAEVRSVVDLREKR
jgi:DNA polymerase-3 subunit gamma/tau